MSIRRSLAWAFSGQLIAFAVQFGGMIVISRLLSPHETGTYLIAMAALGLMQAFTSFGIGSYVVREVNLSAEVLEATFTVNAALALSLSILLIALSFATGPMLGTVEAGGVLRVIALGNLFGIVSFRSSAMLQREMRFKQLAIISVCQVSTQTLATICFALAGASFMSPAYASLLAAAVATGLTLVFGHEYIGFAVSTSQWGPIVKFGLQMMSVSGVAAITGSLSDLLLGRILGVTALGLYGRASNLSSMVFNNLYGTATRVVFVQLSEDYRNGGDWRGTFLRSFAMITGVMWPLLIGLAILAGPAVMLLYGEKWLPAALPLTALMIAQFVGVAFGMNWELFVLRGETGRQSRYEVARLVFGVPLFAVGCSFGIVAAGAAKIFDAVIGLVLYYPHVRRLANLGPSEVPAIYRDSVRLTLVAVLPALITMLAYRWSAHTPLVIVLGSVLAGVLLWLATIIVTRHPLRYEMLLLARRVLLARVAQ